MSCTLRDFCIHAVTHPSPLLLLCRCSPMEHLFIAQTYWMTVAVWLCWLWASCCSPLCWSWLSPPTVAWPVTSSWECVSFPTAVLSTRTFRPHANGKLMQEAAAGRREAQTGRGRGAYGCRRGEVVYGCNMHHCLMMRVGLIGSFFLSKLPLYFFF